MKKFILSVLSMTLASCTLSAVTFTNFTDSNAQITLTDSQKLNDGTTPAPLSFTQTVDGLTATFVMQSGGYGLSLDTDLGVFNNSNGSGKLISSAETMTVTFDSQVSLDTLTMGLQGGGEWQISSADFPTISLGSAATDTVLGLGSVTANAGTPISFTTSTGSASLRALDVTVIPEPSAFMIPVVALIGCFILRRKLRRS